MAVDCIHPPAPPSIPSGWTLAHACATDTPTRILQNAVITTLSDNTPANCIAHCSALTYRFAGVENGNECHCGTGYTDAPTDNPTTQCTAACTGNSASFASTNPLWLAHYSSSIGALPAGWS